MATGVFYLRPSADISVEHTLHPSDSTAAYLLINEEVSDENSTYIVAESDHFARTVTSVFKMAGTVPNEKIKVTNISVGVSSKSYTGNVGSHTCEITINGVSSISQFQPGATLGSEFKTSSLSCDDLLDVVNTYIATNGIGGFPDVIATIMSDFPDYESPKGTYPGVYVSQVYMEVTYTTDFALNIHRKMDGAWKQAQSAYQKTNGAWTEISEDECKSILQNSFIINN